MSLTGEREVQQDGGKTRAGPVGDPGGAVWRGATEGETSDGARRQGEWDRTASPETGGQRQRVYK